KNGLLRPALLEKMARKMKEQHDNTVWPKGWCEWKTEEEIKEIHPGINCVGGGYWLPIGLTVEVDKYLKAYANYLEGCGVKFFLNEQANIINEKNGWKLELQNTSVAARDLVFAIGRNTTKYS